MRMPTHHRFLASLALFPALWLGVSQAQAHAKLVSASPEPRSTVAAPKMIELHFSESIARKLSNFKLTGSDGQPVACTAMDAKDAKSLSAVPGATLGSGTYTVTWTAVSTDDGHKMTGTYGFTVK